MSVRKRASRVEHAKCGTRVVAIMAVPQSYAVEALDLGTETESAVVYETAELVSPDAPGDVEDLGYWCCHCVRTVGEDELVPVWDGEE